MFSKFLKDNQLHALMVLIAVVITIFLFPPNLKQEKQLPQDDINNGDLPPSSDMQILTDIASNDCIDEGRAMMQLIHDVAPGSTMAITNEKSRAG